MNASEIDGGNSHISAVTISQANDELNKKLEEEKIQDQPNKDITLKVPKLNFE